MVHHGHKTEEREHALIKKSSINLFKGAQGKQTLCLFPIAFMMAVAVLCLPLSATAQVYNTQGDKANAEIRLQQMENQIRDLTGRVEEQDYQINQLKQKLLNVQNAQIQMQSKAVAPAPQAGQIAVPNRDPSITVNKPLDLGFKPPQPTGIQVAKPNPATTVPAGGKATAQYEEAYANIRAKNYDTARAGFEDFLINHKDHVLAANAKYWLGETYYVQGQYKSSAKAFAEGFQSFPDSAKSPDMLLKLGMSLAGMKKTKDACVALSQVPVKFPSGNVDVLARAKQEMDRLACES